MTRWQRRTVRTALAIVALAGALRIEAQNSISVPRQERDGLLMPEANRPPDKNDQLLMKQKKLRARNFDAANALRRKQIDEDSMKLLILAADLKKQVDALGDQPVPEKLLREAAVIELLARDVQSRMTLTVSSD